jgi:hypothetical protein
MGMRPPSRWSAHGDRRARRLQARFRSQAIPPRSSRDSTSAPSSAPSYSRPSRWRSAGPWAAGVLHDVTGATGSVLDGHRLQSSPPSPSGWPLRASARGRGRVPHQTARAQAREAGREVGRSLGITLVVRGALAHVEVQRDSVRRTHGRAHREQVGDHALRRSVRTQGAGEVARGVRASPRASGPTRRAGRAHPRLRTYTERRPGCAACSAPRAERCRGPDELPVRAARQDIARSLSPADQPPVMGMMRPRPVGSGRRSGRGDLHHGAEGRSGVGVTGGAPLAMVLPRNFRRAWHWPRLLDPFLPSG